MTEESTGFPGLSEAQSELLQHWRDGHVDGALPMREHLDPGAIRAQLSRISMIEICDHGRTRFRLVGSDLRRVFGKDMRGRRLSDLDQESYEMWSLGLASVLDRQRPIGGLIERETDCHIWLRLPLRDRENQILVLCHDDIVPNSRRISKSDTECSISQTYLNNIAA